MVYGTGNYQLDQPTGRKHGSYSWSQEGQDIFVDRLLGSKKKQNEGFFVEIGGYDGEKFSNSLYFEHQYGWNGLLVEANPYTFQQMLKRDRKCAMVNACISRSLPSMDFKIGGGLTSATQTASDGHLNRIGHNLGRIR